MWGSSNAADDNSWQRVTAADPAPNDGANSHVSRGVSCSWKQCHQGFVILFASKAPEDMTPDASRWFYRGGRGRKAQNVGILGIREFNDGHEISIAAVFFYIEPSPKPNIKTTQASINNPLPDPSCRQRLPLRRLPALSS